MDKLEQNIHEVQTKIKEAALRSGRSQKDVTLVAVTKTVTAEIIEKLIAAGIQHIGENRVLDAKAKKNIITDSCQLQWHMIGHLQRNKVKIALQTFDYFHSIDSIRLAEEINQRATACIPILLEVNVSNESSKYGFCKQEIEKNIEKLLTLPNLRIEGLMTMAPFTDNMEICRNCFRQLRQLAEKLQQRFASQINLTQLSMGMSQDYEVAIEEGATLVRVGSALFRG